VSGLVEVAVGIVLAAGAVYYVLRPVLMPSAPVDRSGPAALPDVPDPEDDLSTGAIALRALKEIEFDRATGKLADADYQALKRQYTAEALSALRATDEAPAAASGISRSAATAPRSPLPTAACPAHGPRPESEAAFCSECGRRLAAATGFCARCGTVLEPEARFCARCGGRVAA
jgi:hypothetical protein